MSKTMELCKLRQQRCRRRTRDTAFVLLAKILIASTLPNSAEADDHCTPAFIGECCVSRGEFNCSHAGLQGLEGIYEGTSINYLSFATDISSPNFRIRQAEFERCTGGTINIAEAGNVWEDPLKDLGTKTAKGNEIYDGYFMSYSHFPEASALGLAEHLQERIREDNSRIKWEDMLPKVQEMGKYKKDGITNIDFLMFDGDFFVPLVRLDLLQRDGFALPNTWEEVVTIAKHFNGTDLNEDGEPDFGFCHFPRSGAGFWDWWFPEAVYSTWAVYEQTKGLDEGFMFDTETFEPQIGMSFKRATEIWKDLWVNGADGCITDNFITGRCAIGFAPPGCWKRIFLEGVKREQKDENGTVVAKLWEPTMEDGTYAEPYRFRSFGSLEVYDKDTDAYKKCDDETCPLGEVIPSRGHHGDDDRASVLVPSKHAGQRINRAPFFWSGGLGTLIRKSSTDEKKDMMWNFFVYTNSPDTSVTDVASYASWLDSWRSSQLIPGDNFIDGGWSADAYFEHLQVMTWALSDESNGALNLRIPGLKKYTHDVLGNFMQQYIKGNISVDELASQVTTGWNRINHEEGLLDQLTIYRAALGRDGLSEVDFCRLHREEMDIRDPSVCRKYDPESTNMTLIIALIASLGAVIVIGAVAFGLWWIIRTYKQKQKLEKERERQYFGMIKDALDNMEELQHPMVLIPAQKFLDIGSLKSYETLRDNQGGLKVLDNMQMVREFKKEHTIVFLSHQWLGWGIPDPNNTHYDAMCRTVLKTPELIEKTDNGGAALMEKVYVWVDFVSISQTHRGLQSLAISSLPSYASAADCFSIIAPNATHNDSKETCNPGTYNMRGWCRAEMLSKVCASGLRNMFLVSGDGVDVEAVTEETPLSFKLFEGDFSCCQLKHTVGTGSCDKESLRVPALGLYSIALRRAHDRHVGEVLRNMRAERESFFPSTYRFESDECGEERELFGPLIEKMEKYVEETHGTSIHPAPCDKEDESDNIPSTNSSDKFEDH
uniref:Uncharacterized protein n=1 Tax=Helicotheca tamesis TaxID=374047 RepID=A0A7S2MVN4_9STRA|mmetsp:Transcript_4264/g.5812  ORF Transcript_4264/g.5812 Transcript_4264/m.5812 type:complete len:998 (+) Transcript_4264:16-3009(+)